MEDFLIEIRRINFFLKKFIKIFFLGYKKIFLKKKFKKFFFHGRRRRAFPGVVQPGAAALAAVSALCAL